MLWFAAVWEAKSGSPKLDTSSYPLHGLARLISLPYSLLDSSDSWITLQKWTAQLSQEIPASYLPFPVNASAILFLSITSADTISTEMGNGVLNTADSHYPDFWMIALKTVSQPCRAKSYLSSKPGDGLSDSLCIPSLGGHLGTSLPEFSLYILQGAAPP